MLDLGCKTLLWDQATVHEGQDPLHMGRVSEIHVQMLKKYPELKIAFIHL